MADLDYEKLYAERVKEHEAKRKAEHAARVKKYGSFNPLAGRKTGILIEKIRQKKKRESEV